MIETTTITWIIAIFGTITFLPLFVAQLIMILKPNSQKAKDLIIGKGEDWRDRTHFKSALAFAWADLIIILPLYALGTMWVFNDELWGYIIWISLGVLSIYFSIFDTIYIRLVPWFLLCNRSGWSRALEFSANKT